MRKLLCFAVIVVMAVSMEGFGQYYKVLYTPDYGTVNTVLFYNIHNDYNPADYENDGKSELVIMSYDSLSNIILDGSTFAKKYGIKKNYTYNGKTLDINTFFGFYDIDGDNEREAVINANYPDSAIGVVYGLAFLNIKTQVIEYFNGDIYRNLRPAFFDINADGYIELIGMGGIIGHSTTPVAQAQPLPLSKKPSLSITTYPNPTTSLAKINYNVPIPSIVNIAVYNAAGRQVKQLIQGRKPAGNFTEIWNGKSDDGEVLAPGEYYYDVRVGNVAAMKKVVMLK